MKKSFVLAAAILCAAVSGCNNQDSAESALSGAYSAAQQDDLYRFRSFLTDSALQQYGDEAGIKTVISDFANLKKADLTDRKISETYGADGRAAYPTFRVYQVILTENGGPILHSFHVGCDVSWQWVTRGGICSIRRPACPDHTVHLDSEDCKIESFEF